MRYYDLRVWHPKNEGIDEKFKGQHTAGKNGKAGAERLNASPRASLHISSHLIHDQENMEYKPGGSPQTGVFDPGALDISFQISEIDFADPLTNGSETVISAFRTRPLGRTTPIISVNPWSGQHKIPVMGQHSLTRGNSEHHYSIRGQCSRFCN